MGRRVFWVEKRWSTGKSLWSSYQAHDQTVMGSNPVCFVVEINGVKEIPALISASNTGSA
jgi:hypothetical protein